ATQALIPHGRSRWLPSISPRQRQSPGELDPPQPPRRSAVSASRPNVRISFYPRFGGRTGGPRSTARGNRSSNSHDLLCLQCFTSVNQDSFDAGERLVVGLHQPLELGEVVDRKRRPVPLLEVRRAAGVEDETGAVPPQILDEEREVGALVR